MSTERHITVEETTWRGIRVRISYEADWLNMGRAEPEYSHAHLQIESASPERARLPFTETGYRSHFLPGIHVDEVGGPVAYVLAWLDEGAQSAEWQKHQDVSRQLSLF